MRFPRQEYWSGLPFPSPRDLPDPGIKPRSPVWQVDSLPVSHLGSPYSHNAWFKTKGRREETQSSNWTCTSNLLRSSGVFSLNPQCVWWHTQFCSLLPSYAPWLPPPLLNWLWAELQGPANFLKISVIAQNCMNLTTKYNYLQNWDFSFGHELYKMHVRLLWFVNRKYNLKWEVVITRNTYTITLQPPAQKKKKKKSSDRGA